MPPDGATEHRDLHSGEAVWQAYPVVRADGGNLARSRRADIVIVGAGITGALIAQALTAAGLSTLNIDRRWPARGSTAAGTALLQYEVDTPLVHLAERIGFERASCA
jgi:ribulose 1,5-bisphosphate synthetase/thiazole synthase